MKIFGRKMIENVDVVGESETTHFVIFDSHIASMLKCCILSNNSIIFEGCHDQWRVGSKDDSHKTIILTKPTGRGWCTIITTKFVIGRLSSCIYDKIRVGAKSTKGCNRKEPTEEYLVYMVFC